MLQRLLNAFKSAPAHVSARPSDGAPDRSVDVAHGLVLGGQNSAALSVLERRLAAAPDDADALALKGWILVDQGASDEARTALARVLQLKPEHVEALNTLGALEADDPDPQRSMHWFRAALKSDSQNLAALYNLAQKLFFVGEYAEGFRLLRARHQLHFKRDNPLEPLPIWRGENLQGKRVFVWCDWGGLGDHLMFIRFVGRLREHANPARVIVGAQPTCMRLFVGMPGIDEVAQPGAMPQAEVHCPLLDLPHHLGVTTASVEADAASFMPYLRADDALTQLWSERIGRLCPPDRALRVGLVWGNDQRTGAAAHERARQAKAVPPQALAGLAASGARFFGLQLGATPDELAATGLDVIDLAPDVKDFADTAAIIAALDLVISADTSVAHLAGAMGKPVLLMLGEAGGMFWPRTGAQTPWYPSMEIARQESGAWRVPVNQASLMIERAASHHPIRGSLKRT